MNCKIISNQSPTKLFLCNKCKKFCQNIHPYNNFKYCKICQCETKGCISSWYICSFHGCRYSTMNKRFHQHFQNEEHIIQPTIVNKSTLVDQTTDSLNVSDICNETIIEYWNADYDDEYDGSLCLNNSLSEDRMLANKKIKLNNTDDNNFAFQKSELQSSTKRYYEDEIKQAGSGILGIVGRSFFANNNGTKLASQSETITHFKITKLCNSITEDNQRLLASILHDFTKKNHFKWRQ